MQKDCYWQSKLAWVGEWNSGLKIYDFEHKLYSAPEWKEYIL